MKKRIIWILSVFLILSGCASTDSADTGPTLSDLQIPSVSTSPATDPPPSTQPTPQTTAPTTEQPTEESGYLYDPMLLAGTWDMAYTEIEGEQSEVAPGTCTIIIYGVSPDALSIILTDKDFPEESFSDKALVLDEREMYHTCGNPDWVVDVDYIDSYGTEFSLTLIDTDTLLLQRYFEIEGIPMVSYQTFKRIA